MSDELLGVVKKAGLNDAQAKVYLALVENGELTPTELAKITGESRENCYNIAKKLEDLKVVRNTGDKKAKYQALNPSSLEVIAERRRKIVQRNELELKEGMNSLMSLFYANNELPGSRTLQGMSGVKEAYFDALRTKKDVYLIRTVADKALGDDDHEEDFLHQYREQLPKLGMHTYAITPDTAHARRSALNGRDEEVNFHRTFMPENAYTAPVAIHIYGDKVAFIAFGETQMTTIISSPAIAEAMRQLHGMLTNFYQQNYPQKGKKKRL